MKSVVEDQNIVVLKADMTEDDQEINDTLIGFGNTALAIPYYAVYEPGKEPHHFAGNFTAVGAKGFLDTAGITQNNPQKGDLASGPYSAKAVESELAKGNSVLVNFSADWDLVSKFNEKMALNTPLAKGAMEQNGIVVLKADMTEESPEAKETLRGLGNTAMAIPYYVLYRPGKEPHHFGGNFTTVGAEGFLEQVGINPYPSLKVNNVNGVGQATSDSETVADARLIPAG